MNRNGPYYLAYLEAVVLSLLREREQQGRDDFTRVPPSDIAGIDIQGNPVTYSPYNIKELLAEQNPELTKAIQKQ